MYQDLFLWSLYEKQVFIFQIEVEQKLKHGNFQKYINTGDVQTANKKVTFVHVSKMT